MGMRADSSLRWGFRLDHSQVEKWLVTALKHYPHLNEDDEESQFVINVMGLENVHNAYAFTFDFDDGYFGGRKELMVYWNDIGGKVSRCEEDGFLYGMNSIGLGSALDEKKNAVCDSDENKGKWENLKKALFLEEAGLEVEAQWLLIVGL